jgi:hypothetical protein
MKLSSKLSSGLVLALSIALPSVLFSTTAKAEPAVNKAPSAINQTVAPIKVSPNIGGKVGSVRPNGKNPGDAAWEFSLTIKGDEASKVKPVAKTSATETLRSINQAR